MTTVTEGTFNVRSTSFYSKTWTPRGVLKAKLVFAHGFGEHLNRYNDFFPKLATKGIEVYAWDKRGWGRSIIKASEEETDSVQDGIDQAFIFK